MQTMEMKLKQAREYLGTNWVLSKHSTYDPKRREPGMCATLRPVVARAIAEERL